MAKTNGQAATASTAALAGDEQQKTKQQQITTTTSTTPPVVLWAQRADKLFLTLQIQDCKEPEIKLEKEKLYFKGKSDSIQEDADHAEHELTIEFYKPINIDESKHSVRARGIEFIIIKEDLGWWPRLLKDSTKQHWLRVDFPKWKDEDDSDDEQGMGGMGMPGMEGLGGMGAGGMGGFGGFGGGGQPDFGDFMQQFGGAAGGMPGAGDDEEFESDDDDTEQSPPDLE